MKIIATVPARLGSKRVKQKNLRLMNGEKPMVWYALRAALDATSIETVYVNSDGDEIGDIGTEMGANFYRRKPELANDHATSDEFNYDFMKNVEADIVVMVNPVAPLITTKEIDEMVAYFLDHNLDTLIPVREEHLHAFCESDAINFDPQKPVQSLCGCTPVNFTRAGPLPRTQDNAALKICVWTVCIWRRKTFMRAYEETGAAVFSGKVGFYPQHPITAIKVSNEEDFRFAELLLRYDYLWRYPQIDYDSAVLGENHPSMWMNEIAYIEDLLCEKARPSARLRVLEWGSGNSTIHFASFLEKQGIDFEWHAVENYYPWFRKVDDMVREAGLEDSTHLYLKSETFEDRKDRQEESDMSEFIEFPLHLGEEFDVVIVDARKRGQCLEVAAKLLASDGVAILHDAERSSAHWAFKYFQEGGRFVVENESPVPGGIQKLWAGQRAEAPPTDT